MTKPFEPVQLGDRVKDPITGAKGIVTVITTWLYGTIRVGVQPELANDKGEPVEARNYDQGQVKLVKRGVHAPVVLAARIDTSDIDVQLGDRVRDPVTGATGIAVCASDWLYGCRRFGVQPERVDEKGDPPDPRYYDAGQLHVVDRRVIAPTVLTARTALPPAQHRSTGGPAREGAGFRRA